MATKAEHLQRAWHLFERQNGHLPASAREAAIWAVEQGLIHLPDVDPYDVLAEDMARALREEYGTDQKGRRYRMNHAVRVTRPRCSIHDVGDSPERASGSYAKGLYSAPRAGSWRPSPTCDRC